MLDWCQTNGVRLMPFIIDAYETDTEITSRLDFWIPKLYDHKMFMVMWLHPKGGSKTSVLDASTYKNKFKLVVDHIISLNREEMIIAFVNSDELDIWADRCSITETEIRTGVDDVALYIRKRDDSTLIAMSANINWIA